MHRGARVSREGPTESLESPRARGGERRSSTLSSEQATAEPEGPVVLAR